MNNEKLVRDKVVGIIEKNGGVAAFRIVKSDEEYKEKLKQKFQEEVIEFLESEKLEELADILEVIDAVLVAYGFTAEELKQLKEKKKQERGGFTKRVVLKGS